MTDQEKIIALAELDGIRPETWQWLSDEQFVLVNGGWLRVPNYLTSYDAIIPLIQKQPKYIRLAICKQSLSAFPCDDELNVHHYMMLSPTQLCDTLLTATGKMKQ